MAAMVLAWRMAFEAYRALAGRPEASDARAWAVGLLAALVATLVSAAFLSIPHHPLLWLVVGLVAAPPTPRSARTSRPSTSASPCAYFRAFAVAGVPPAIMGIGPVPAIRKLLAKTGLTIDQIDLFEVNEAFASQALYCVRELGLPVDRVNVNGRDRARPPAGRRRRPPIATALHELERRKGKYAVISMCVGGGMGAAGLIERAA